MTEKKWCQNEAKQSKNGTKCCRNRTKMRPRDIQIENMQHKWFKKVQKDFHMGQLRSQIGTK